MASTAVEVPALRHFTIDAIARIQSAPSQKIRADEDLDSWRTTRGYQDYGIFLRRLNESVVGHLLPWDCETPHKSITSLKSMLDTLDKWIDDIPPLPTPQRFGNLAFRTWGKRLEDEHERLLKDLLSTDLHPAIPHLAPYLLTSFGSFTRMDYGTGHETSFALFLLCLTLIRFVEPEPDVERQIVLIVFLRYLRLCWKLQDVYRLEPAGSHGVWGLDDYSFLSYIFGSAQLREQAEITVSAVIHPPLPPTNLYFLSISRILEVKQGPFFEHSSQLYSIATGVQHWSKVNSGLFKMYEAEVLGKRVVVQHIPLGGFLEWNPRSRIASANDPSSTARNTSAMTASPAPWAATSVMADTAVPSSIRGHPSSSFPNSAATSIPFASLGRSGLSHHPRHPGGPQRNPGPLVAAQMPLGPLASTTLQSTRVHASGASRSAGPTTPNTAPRPSSAEECPGKKHDH